MLELLQLMRPCSKKMCICYNQAIKLSLYIPISKSDELQNTVKINHLYTKYKLCAGYRGCDLHSFVSKKKR